MKTHVSLHVRDLDASVAFYRAMLGIEPVKHYVDYALFIAGDPSLELALVLDPQTKAAESAHYGIVVDTSDAVAQQIDRLRAAGLPIDVEIEETCCYAVQNKVWATDPDGRRWETYVVLEEVDGRGGLASRCCATGAACSGPTG